MKQIIFFTLCIHLCSFSQNDSVHLIKVHFLYGSKPLKKYKQDEYKYFGGLHGGHVTIEVDNISYGFVPAGKFHVFAHKRSNHSVFTNNNTGGDERYPEGEKYTTFIIPINKEQYDKINQIHSNYCTSTPYDYAFFGMRCAAATQDILGQIGIVKKRNKFWNITTTFYPKKLRKRMFKLAKENNYQITFQEGRNTRKWEKD